MNPRHTVAAALGPVAALLLFLCIPTSARSAPSPEWQKVEQLINDQKLEEADTLVRAQLEKAKQEKNTADWTHALILGARLRTGLHGYETSVKELLTQPWPEDPLSQTLLHLAAAQGLLQYTDAYSYEINKREKTATTTDISNLKAWTTGQIQGEALKHYLAVWKIRSRLESHSTRELRDFFDPGTYPEKIRPTLRDAFTYLFARFLSDPRGWSPEESNELFTVSLAQLLEKPPTDPEAAKHPAEKFAAVLADLERKHGRTAPGAALEARLELLRLLSEHFKQPADRELIRKHLVARLKAFRSSFPKEDWWAAGMGQLAQFVREEEGKDALFRAHQIATDCQPPFPGSWGSQLCLSIAKNIEAPSYDVQSMASDGLERRSILIRYRNVGKLYFRAYRYDFLNAAKDKEFNPANPQGNRFDETVRSAKPDFTWSVLLPKTADFRDTTFVLPHQIRENGFCQVAVSAREDFSPANNDLHGFTFNVSPFAILHRNLGTTAEYTVVDGNTGQPIPAAKATLYRYSWDKPAEVFATAQTDARGMVRFEAGLLQKYLGIGGRWNYFLLAEKNGVFALNARDTDWYGRTRSESTKTLIYTDRSTYRPLQRIRWKILEVNRAASAASAGPQGPNKSVAAARLRVDLVDPNHQVVRSETVTTNRFGTASGEFVIPSGKMLGRWTILAPHGSVSIRVEEYKRPTFEARIADPSPAPRLNQSTSLTGEAKYYFGLPVPRGSVRWRVSREPVFPAWWIMARPDGDDEIAPGASAQTIASGTAVLNGDGTFKVAFTPKADERLAADVAASGDASQITYRYSISADVTDEGGETRSVQRILRIGFTTVEAKIQPEAEFFRPEVHPSFTVSRASLDGIPVAGNGSWEIRSLDPPAETILPADFPGPGGTSRPRWDTNYTPEQYLRSWKTGESKRKGTLTAAQARIDTEPLAPGAYRLRYETADEQGQIFSTERDFVVSDSSVAKLPLPLLLRAENSTVEVGQTARFYVTTGFRDQVVNFEIFREGTRTETRQLVFPAGGFGGPALIEIPVTEKLRGGFGISVSTIRDYQHLTATAAVFVPWDNKELKLSFSSFRDLLHPGARETWKIQVQGPGKSGPNTAAEVLAYMFDRSLDLFGEHVPPQIMTLFPNLSQISSPSSNLSAAASLWLGSQGFARIPGVSPLSPDQLKRIDRYGIGGPGRRRGFFAMEGMNTLRALPQSASKAEPPNKSKKMEVAEMADTASADLAGAPPQASDGAAPVPAENSSAPRANFAETAFWFPHLHTDASGTATLEFTVPDSVTGWHVWLHALTSDLKNGTLQKDAVTVKDLMVRPYLPRFLREGDEAAIRVVLNNAGKVPLSGEVTLDILDAETEKSVLARFAPGTRPLAFSIPPSSSGNASTTVQFPIRVPAQIGAVAFRIMAKAGNFSDGELRPLPVLPGRMHLAQSRFAILKDTARKELRFEDLEKNEDSSLINEQLVVTLDAQLFYSVLASLPYLVKFPYDCTEQLMNSFLSTGILTSLYKQFPAVERMAKKLSERKTRFERFDSQDPNRKMALEETPWLEMARGGPDHAKQHGGVSPELVNVLDSSLATAHREAALTKLLKAQNADGGFPWFPGGSSSPYITLYLLHGFSKGLEFGVTAPKPAIHRGWNYLHHHFLGELLEVLKKQDTGWEFITFLNYTLTNFPDASWTPSFTEQDRRTMLDFSFKHWREHSPYLKGYLALTLKRQQRPEDARLVWSSVMDSAKSSEAEGTHWAAEDRSWLWYNDTIETHAFALRTLMEFEPENSKMDGLVLWLLLNKKLNHWKSTRATAEVVYSLTHYFKRTGQLGVREEAKISTGPLTRTFTFRPDEYTGGKNQLVITPPSAAATEFSAHSPVTIEKKTPGYLFASATWHFSTEKPPLASQGDFLTVTRKYFRRAHNGKEFILEPLGDVPSAKIGEEIEVQLSIRSRHPMEYVQLRDPRGAGFEPVTQTSRHQWDFGLAWFEEVRDSGNNFFFERLPQGEFTFKYRLRATLPGKFRVGPATLQGVYAPEFNAYSSGAVFTVTE